MRKMTLTFKNSYIQEKKFNPCIQRVSVLKAIDTLGNFNNRYFFTNSNKTDDCALKIENYRENDHRKIITMILILCYVDLAITAGYAWFGCLLVKHLSFLIFFLTFVLSVHIGASVAGAGCTGSSHVTGRHV